MANSFGIDILQEGPRNAVVKLTGILDSGDITAQSIIALSDFTNNDKNLFLTGFRVDFIEYSMSNGMEINLFWNSTNPEQIAPLAGRGRFGGRNYGGITPDTTRTGYDGSINMSTSGTGAGVVNNFTVILELVKMYNVHGTIASGLG
jgi:hypothetical protein